ncbi:hypothetical protein [Kutzneria albida]|uniref:Uncharacterized protein n=1 Tax=Kutzneria albida DSM 43870 TaxID=1449976 RepID=W5W8X3_9PSEU|nr:hypothetical protein [Kutzneria albida]AHH97598.1 hypothetical protein KALB_4235 [Kutzneria albida DSM 43870]
MTLWRRGRKPPPLEYNWTDRVNSVDAHLAFSAHIYLTVHPDPERRTGEADAGGAVVVPPSVSQAAVWARSEVEEVTREWDVLHRHAAQHSVNERVGQHLPHTLYGAVVGSVTVALSVSEDDTRAAHALQQAHREAHLDEIARRQAAATLRFLREECFDNPASARLFLMLNTNTRLGVFPSAQQADEVVAEVTRWHPDSLWVQVAKTLHTVLGALTPGQTEELLRVLAAALHSTGHSEQAHNLDDLRSRADRGEDGEATGS